MGRRNTIDATQLYDVRSPDATQLYNQAEEIRADPNETQLYDDVIVATRRTTIEETQLYDQSSVITRKSHVEETQLYDGHVIAAASTEATQLYDQGARDEEATQLYDHRDEEKGREREMTRKRRHEEESSEAMETLIYDEVSSSSTLTPLHASFVLFGTWSTRDLIN